MKSFKTNLGSPAWVVLAFFVLAGLAPQNLLGQTVSASPASLAFGIPTGTSPALSAPETVTVNITGSGSVTFSSFALGAGSPFTIAGNSCANSATTPPNTFAAPATCQITVTLTTTSTALVTDTLAISYGSDSSLLVPLSGAYGAIELWEETNVTQSVASASYTNLYTIASAGLNLSCPNSPTATLSYTPDGLGYVLVDNYLTLAIGGAAVSTGNNPPGNVCSGGPADSSGGISYNDCFSTNYQVPAGTNYGLNGDDPDTFTSPNQILTRQSGNATNAGGLPPINVNSYFPAGGGTVQATFTALDSGYVYTTSTLFLVTNCSPAGIIPGGSVTLNPINTSNPQSETQTATFSSSPGENISVTTSDAVAIQGGTQIPSGIVPIVTDYPVPQQLFYQLVAGTSAAPAVCLRMSGELDEFGAPMCKGFLLQCYNPADGTTTGDNCAPTLSAARNLYYAAQFSSPDGPVNGYNFLYGPVNNQVDSCSNVVPGGGCAVGTGPGMLMGSDNWLCATVGSPCPAVANTQTPLNPPTYSTANCVLTGSVTGALCPLDILTEFEGAADIRGGSTTDGGNSIIIPVANMPLPTATVAVASENANSWIHGSSTISATFNSTAATYPNTGSIPPPNGFSPVTAASPYSLTYGISAWPTLPDTTYPVTGDLMNSNSHTTTTSPFCNSGGPTPSTFASAGSFSGLTDGIYNLHYFTTDCAFTEGLIFNPTGSALTDPTANWASFPFATVGIDNLAPQVSSCTSAPTSTGGWYGANFSQYCTVTDQSYTAGVSGSGFLPLLANSIQGSATEVVTATTNAAAGLVSVGVPATAASPACDLAGNCVPVSTGSYNFDLQAPAITGPTLGSAAPYYVNGPPIAVTFTCSDGAGSGISSCIASGPGYSLNSCTGSTPVSCTGTISTSTAVSGTLTVTAIDNVGNKTTSTVSYAISVAPSADVWVGDIPLPLFIAQGKSGTYYPFAIDLSTSTANNVVVTSTFTVPNKVLNGGITGTYATVSCSKIGCTGTPTGGTSCSVSTTVGTSTTVAVLTCNIGQLVSISKLQGVVMKINIPILSTAAVNTTFSSVTVVTSDNDPNPKNNSVPETYTVIK